MGVKKHPEYGQGIGVIPVIALSYVFLGIYYNLTVWYKLTDRTIYGAYITIAGAVLTVALNYFTIPVIGYWGSAWTTLICYGFMMVVSYRQGQKHYPIPYAWKKLVAYVLISVALYILYFGVSKVVHHKLVLFAFASLLLFLFLLFIGRVERKEFSRLPFIKRLYKVPVRAAVAVSTEVDDNMKA